MKALHELDLTKLSRTYSIEAMYPEYEPHLIFRDGSELSGCCAFTGHSADSDVNRAPDRSACGNPVTNFVRDDLNESNAWVVLITLVYAIAEVTKPRRHTVRVTEGQYMRIYMMLERSR